MKSRDRSIKRLRIAIFVMGAIFGNSERTHASQLVVDDLLVEYATQTATDATGQVSFTLRFASLAGDPGNFDLVTTQVRLPRSDIGPVASFSLNEAATEDTGPIGDDYWLPTPPTFFENASMQGDEFRFSDFVSTSRAYTPDVGDIIARFVIDFTVNSADEFGIYEVLRGDRAQNFFSSDLTQSFPIEIEGDTFTLEPIPEPATLAPMLFALCVLRRRR